MRYLGKESMWGCVLYPFHIAKAAATPHFTPLSINAATLRCASVCFYTERRISAFWRVRFKKRSEVLELRFPSTHAIHKRISLRIIRCILSHRQPHHRKLQLLARIRFQNTSRGSSRHPTSNAAFLTPVSKNAASEHSHWTVLFSKGLWLRIIGLIWKGY